LTNKSKGWKHHPVVKMWNGCASALHIYLLALLKEWLLRRFYGYVKGFKLFDGYTGLSYYEDIPKWWGNEKLHKSHRLNLLYKNPEHYSKYFKEKVPKTKPDYYYPKFV
jgi:hypothetical protein